MLKKKAKKEKKDKKDKKSKKEKKERKAHHPRVCRIPDSLRQVKLCQRWNHQTKILY